MKNTRPTHQGVGFFMTLYLSHFLEIGLEQRKWRWVKIIKAPKWLVLL